jgi:hypothetical protein
MKKLGMIAGLVGILGAGVVGVAVAGGGKGRGMHHKKAMMEKFDADKDGKLDDDEKAALKAAMEKRRAEMEKRHAEREQAMLEKYDANDDGKLDDAERAEAREDRLVERFTEMDTDGDGVLSFDEFKAGKEKGKRFGKRHHDRDQKKGAAR